MNGQFPLPVPPAAPLAGKDRRRLAAALAASATIHAIAIFLPYLGQPSRPPAAQRLPPFAATLTVARAPQRVAAFPPSPPAPPPTAVETKPEPIAEEPSAGADLLPLPAPAYYATDELTKRPQPQVLEELDTPETKALVASGTLVLKLWIDDRGIVSDAVVEKSDLPPIFGNAAVDAFKRSRFAPGERDGRRVGTVMRIEISYDDPRSAVR